MFLRTLWHYRGDSNPVDQISQKRRHDPHDHLQVRKQYVPDQQLSAKQTAPLEVMIKH
jgi:hypothetical protein